MDPDMVWISGWVCMFAYWMPLAKALDDMRRNGRARGKLISERIVLENLDRNMMGVGRGWYL